MTLPELIAHEVELRKQTDAYLKDAGFKGLKDYLTQKSDIEKDLPDDFSQEIGKYTATVETKHVMTYPKATAVITDSVKRLKIHG